MSLRVDITHQAFESLARFDTSKTEQLEIFHGNPSSMIAPHQALFSMGNLRSLTLSQCKNPFAFISALHPTFLTSDVAVCPKLEELVLIFRSYGGCGLQYRACDINGGSEGMEGVEAQVPEDYKLGWTHTFRGMEP